MKNKNGLIDNSISILLMITCAAVFLALVQTICRGNNSCPPAKAGYEEQDLVQTDAVNIIHESEDVLEGMKPTQEMHEMGNVIQEQPMIPVLQLQETYEFTASEKSYFDDALFIGDSRTVGLKEYGTLDNVDYFATPGLNLYTIEKTRAEGVSGEKISLDEMLTQKTYGKVYLMLGINELGYDFDTTVKKYETFIEYLRTSQPEAILYVCANLHVNSLRNEVDEIHNNEAINRMNEVIQSFADQKDIFYLDANPLFDDEEGNLSEAYISDDSHLLGQYYEIWCEWYLENTIVKE